MFSRYVVGWMIAPPVKVLNQAFIAYLERFTRSSDTPALPAPLPLCYR
jgi:hypothetical protein